MKKETEQGQGIKSRHSVKGDFLPCSSKTMNKIKKHLACRCSCGLSMEDVFKAGAKREREKILRYVKQQMKELPDAVDINNSEMNVLEVAYERLVNLLKKEGEAGK